MMDEDDVKPAPGSPLKALMAEDLEALSREELKARITLLEAEIERARHAIEAKGSLAGEAEALFWS